MLWYKLENKKPIATESRNLKLTTTLDGAITQNPCYVPLNLEQ